MLTTEANWSKVYKFNPLCSHSHLCVWETNIMVSRVPRNQNKTTTKFSVKNVIQFSICSTASFSKVFWCVFIILTPEFWSTPWNSYCPCVTRDKHNVPPYRVQMLWQISGKCTPNLDNVFCCSYTVFHCSKQWQKTRNAQHTSFT